MIIIGIDPGTTSGWCEFDYEEGSFEFKVGEEPVDNIVDTTVEMLIPDLVIIEAANGEKGCCAAYVGGIWEGVFRSSDLNDSTEFRKQYPAERRGMMPLASKITKKDHARDAVSHVLAYLKKFEPKVFEKVKEKYDA